MLQRGAVLSGKYRIDGVLGEGGMAVVYAVTHLRNTARLAVKVLHEGSALKGHVRARFVREGKVANCVKHPGAVQMLDDGVGEDGSPYLVMEHLNGVSVEDLRASAIPLRCALNVAYQVLDVLRAAHENSIIHRDIKPANLFVLRTGRVKVLDFGISRLHDGAEPFDSQTTGSVMGTPYFMAPEQARADASEIDARTDLFAVGATLFTLISGEYLHPGDDSRQVMLRAATRPARSLDSVAAETPRAIVDLVARAVAYERDARWESAQAMQDAVRQLHEQLFGPIEFEALANMVLAHEFRRKSHARLTAPKEPLPWASAHVASSPVSTTLPAVAGSTRSVESFRALASHHESAHLRPSSESPELAGWTGQVEPARATAGHQIPAAHSGRWRTARMVRVGMLSVAAFALLFGFVHLHMEAPPIEKPIVSRARPAAPIHTGLPNLGGAGSAPTAPHEAAPNPSAAVARRAPSPKPRSAPRPLASTQTPPANTSVTSGRDRAPSLILPLEHFAH